MMRDKNTASNFVLNSHCSFEMVKASKLHSYTQAQTKHEIEYYLLTASGPRPLSLLFSHGSGGRKELL